MKKTKADKKEQMFDVLMFFLMAVITISLSSYIEGVNLVVRDNQSVRSTSASLLQAGSLLGVVPSGVSNNVISNSDRKILESCLPRTKGNIEHACLSSDFNKDHVIDKADENRFNAASVFDLNKDGAVDLNYQLDTDTLTDYRMFVSCYKSNISSECEGADFNGDSEINNDDLDMFFGAAILDLNRDGYVTTY